MEQTRAAVAADAAEAGRQRVGYRYLDLITALFVAVLLISNVVGQKIWRLGPLDMSAAQMLFPVSYIFGDAVIGEAVDSILVIGITFTGALPVGTMVRIVLSMYFFKVAYEAAVTPVTYAVVNWLKRQERIDFYDYGTNFNPFIAM